MTQILVTLENGADSTLLQRMIENMKGVLKASVQSNVQSRNDGTDSKEWIRKMMELSNSIDTSVVDMDDERTRYLMSR